MRKISMLIAAATGLGAIPAYAEPAAPAPETESPAPTPAPEEPAPAPAETPES